MEAFYRPLGGGLFASTPATAGPWSPHAQHAGPVAGLLGHVLERHEPDSGGGSTRHTPRNGSDSGGGTTPHTPRNDPDSGGGTTPHTPRNGSKPRTRIARVTVEILGPVPVAELAVTARVLRPGRRVALLEAEMTHAGRPVARATAWRILAAPERLPSVWHAPAPPPMPAAASPLVAWEGAHLDGYLSAMEWRVVEGALGRPGPGVVWARPRIPLVAGEADTPLVRALVLADSASGVGSQLDLSKWLIINTDLTVALHRDPVGEWLCMGAALHASALGSALCEATLADRDGDVGRVLQTLLVDELPSA
ncbi:thioesterase family protein [Actinomadura sp. NEAU-AAG7]|uniref:thioesterase family protein n=1 Tax=Actinomadura sp. NEAU-AAG7 TaxID=2839640 RepID=UPI001BE433A8|nr:thioesterase family protein [Actinomadura sp. NEAU-AAG7]MBT2210644.1 thioesterase family protein [Actinomadura sp. NEAU-AAG7]